MDSANLNAHLVTGDETWLHHHDPETKLESVQWKHKGSTPCKTFYIQSSAGKTMASIFWDAKDNPEPTTQGGIQHQPNAKIMTGIHDPTDDHDPDPPAKIWPPVM